MVDQLWLWVIKDDIETKDGIQDPKGATDGGKGGTNSMQDTSRKAGVNSKEDTNTDKQSRYTVITSFPNCVGDKVEIDFQVGERDQIANVSDLLGVILARCVQEPTMEEEDAHDGGTTLIEAFQGTIGHLEEKQTRLFEQFNLISTLLSELKEYQFDYQKRRKFLLSFLGIVKELEALREVKDVLDEIGMIQAVLTDQITVLRRLRSSDETSIGFSMVGWRVYDLVEVTLRSFQNMKDRAEAVERGMIRLLDLKQKQVNLWEARISREGAEETARQGNTLLLFTIVTIIFLPLSFISAFFAIDVQQFPQDPDSHETSWPLGYLCGLLFGISFALSIPLILIAIYIDWLKSVARRLRYQWTRRVPIKILDWLSRVNFLGIGVIAGFLQHSLYRSLVEHSGFYEDYIHHIISEERYDSDDESGDSSSSSEEEERVDLSWAYDFEHFDSETEFI
ncbi:hypothetical protein OQA88_12870 [Cercophora sp. LCS_1]